MFCEVAAELCDILVSHNWSFMICGGWSWGGGKFFLNELTGIKKSGMEGVCRCGG